MDVTTERRRELLRCLLQEVDNDTRDSVQQIASGGVEAGAEIYDYVSLGDFADREDVIIRQKAVGSVATAAAAAAAAAKVPFSDAEERTLSPRAQVLIWQLFRAFGGMLDLDICPASVTAKNIRVDTISLRPKLIGLDNILLKTPALVENLMNSLAQIIKDELFLRRPEVLPPLPLEIRHLLACMRSQALALRPVIRYHPALVPLENRGDYMSRIHKYCRDVLRKNDPIGYNYVMDNVFCPQDWGARLQMNTHLHIFFREANNPNTPHEPYNPEGTSIANPRGIWETNSPELKAEADRESHKEAARFCCNFTEHGLDANKNSQGGMRYRVRDMSLMLYSLMDGVLFSLATSLQRMSVFTDVPDIPYLFPGRVVDNA